MIKTALNSAFNHHYIALKNFTSSVYVADYTNQTQNLATRRGVEFFSPDSPDDIDFFTINNAIKHDINGVIFDNSSFVCGNGNSKSQCEAVFFPTISVNDSWVLFCELKYSLLSRNNAKNISKAIKQLYKTRYYYIQEGVINISNASYLIASLPSQTEPFQNFHITPSQLINLKRKKNIILRFTNNVEILNDKTIKI